MLDFRISAQTFLILSRRAHGVIWEKWEILDFGEEWKLETRRRKFSINHFHCDWSFYIALHTSLVCELLITAATYKYRTFQYEKFCFSSRHSVNLFIHRFGTVWIFFHTQLSIFILFILIFLSYQTTNSITLGIEFFLPMIRMATNNKRAQFYFSTFALTYIQQKHCRARAYINQSLLQIILDFEIFMMVRFPLNFHISLRAIVIGTLTRKGSEKRKEIQKDTMKWQDPIVIIDTFIRYFFVMFQLHANPSFDLKATKEHNEVRKWKMTFLVQFTVYRENREFDTIMFRIIKSAGKGSEMKRQQFRI